VTRPWGFEFSTLLVWAKPITGQVAGFPTYNCRTEFVLFCRRGSLKPLSRTPGNWWEWKRGAHSVKPPAFMDIVEEVSPGPYLELFARAPRLGLAQHNWEKKL
jgi:N6-adenosine-specific RNA methylase IME4